MLCEIPRKPILQDSVVDRLLADIARDVQDEVIPVSTGIYSEEKLAERLQAIPKPVLVDYEDTIFYDTIEAARHQVKTNKCPLCQEEYSVKGRAKNKHAPVMCQFCGIWNCAECICHRKRYHPRAKDANSQRYDICYRCDDKFLSLQLNHGYVQHKALFQLCILKTKRDYEQIRKKVSVKLDTETRVKQGLNSNKFKVAQLKKEQIDLKKGIAVCRGSIEQLKAQLDIRRKYLELVRTGKIKRVPSKAKEKQLQAESLQQEDDKEQRLKKVLHMSRAYEETVVVGVRQQSRPTIPDVVKMQELEKLDKEEQEERQQARQSEAQPTLDQQTMLRMAHYFSQGQSFIAEKVEEETIEITEEPQRYDKPVQNPTSPSLQQTCSSEQLSRRRSQLIQAAFQQSLRQRASNIEPMQMQQDDQPITERKHCSCSVY